MSYTRADSNPDRPQYSTFRGQLDRRDNHHYNLCALRTLRELAVLPRHWGDAYSMELASFPEGQRLVLPTNPSSAKDQPTAVWLVAVPDEFKYLSVRLTEAGARDACPDSLQWRLADDVVSNLNLFVVQSQVATALASLTSMFPNMDEEPVVSVDAQDVGADPARHPSKTPVKWRKWGYSCVPEQVRLPQTCFTLEWYTLRSTRQFRLYYAHLLWIDHPEVSLKLGDVEHYRCSVR